MIQLHMKEAKMFYWVSQGPPHDKWLQCLNKRQHSYKNTIRRSLEKISEISLETIDKDQELLALVGYQIPFLMNPVQEKAPKVPKLNQEQQK